MIRFLSSQLTNSDRAGSLRQLDSTEGSYQGTARVLSSKDVIEPQKVDRPRPTFYVLLQCTFHFGKPFDGGELLDWEERSGCRDIF